MKFKIKGLPPIKLENILRKKKTTLKSFLSSSGIFSYQTLLQKCEKMGVSPPSEKEFREAVGDVAVSSPQEGIIVLDSPALLKETGEKLDVDQVKQPVSNDERKARAMAAWQKKKRIKIDESVYVTPVSEDRYEKSDAELGEASTVEDNLDDSVSKLSSLKSSK